MRTETIQFMLAFPETLLLILLCLVMVADLFMKGPQRGNMLQFGALLTIALTFISVLAQWTDVPRVGFNGMFVVDPMASLLKASLLIGVAVLLIYSRAHLTVRNLFTGEFITLLLNSEDTRVPVYVVECPLPG